MANKKPTWSLDEFVNERKKADRRFKRAFEELDRTERATLAASARAIQDLVELRRKRKLTQKQVADAIGVTQPYIAKIERGTEPVGLQTLAAYALAVGGRISIVAERSPKYGG